jgi:cytochrome b
MLDMASDRNILVWDIPTRLFHWLLVVSFVGAFATGESEQWRHTHVLLGYTAGGLIVFRLFWGLIGTRYARFSSLPLHPRAVLRYLRSMRSGSPEHHTGHNPAGSWAILAILTLVAATVVSGWAALVKIGPEMGDLHEGLSNVAVGLVVVHVAAVIISSLLHRENLVRAMFTGFKRGASWEMSAESPNRVVAVLVLAAVAALWAGWIPVVSEAADRTADNATETQRDADD